MDNSIYIYMYVSSIYNWFVVFRHPSEKYEFVSWDDNIPNWMEQKSSHVPNHQPDNICFS